MTDRELLELAAKAAGLRVNFHPTASYNWNPLTDDGDALRLAVTLGLVVDCSRPSAGEPFKHHVIWIDGPCDNAATRRAIVRAAAEIWKAMP